MKDVRAILSTGLAPFYNTFPHYLIKGTIFEKKVTGHEMHVLIFFSMFFFSETFLIVEKN